MGKPDPFFSRRFRFFAVLTAGAIALSTLVVQPAVADTLPSDTSLPATVSADGLPTVQINGVVWSQQVVGSTVFATGGFTTARPAGSAPGANTVGRNNLLSYNIQTGVLNSFNPYLNAPGLVVAKSPDGSRIYVGGDFTSASGATHQRIAAFSTATGQIVASFAPQFNARVRAIVATDTTVYVGGSFTSVGGVERKRLAAVRAADGSVLPWNPIADALPVESMVMAPGDAKLIVGGKFTSIGGQGAYGLAAIDSSSGALLPWEAAARFAGDGKRVANAGEDASVNSLTTDGSLIYGTGYVFGDGGNLEGAFAAKADTGEVVWINDCHGDSYSAYAAGDTLYTAGHAHYCGNIGGFPQTDPWSFYRGIAFSTAATGTVTRDPHGYFNWEGQPSSKLLNWYPSFNTGTYTGQNQGPWNVTGAGDYVVMGGEFTTVNGKAQQGLVRYVTADKAPNAVGPTLTASLKPSAVSLSGGSARIAWQTAYDRDNESLTYKVTRDGNTATPVYTTTVDSTFWERPNIGFVDTGLVPGRTYAYRVYVSDPFGNTSSSGSTTVTIADSAQSSAYADGVLSDGPQSYYRLGEKSGTTVYDYAGFDDALADTGVTRDVSGAVGNDANGAARFSGTASGLVATQSPIEGPNTFAVEAWFKTTSTSGGKIVGFGNKNTGESSSYDRHVYMDADGRVLFGVYPGSSRTVESSASFNDGDWHHVVANLSEAGMALYVDGLRVGTRTDTTIGQDYFGYWRIGGDTSWSGGSYFNGDIDEVAIYDAPLTVQQVNEHFELSGRASPLPDAPSDAYGAAIYNSDPDLYWRLNEPSGPTAFDSSMSLRNGVYRNGVTRQAIGAIEGTTNRAASFDGNDDFVSSAASVSNPSVYSLELWFNSTSTRGGKLIGFGNSDTGLSSNYDRHVYMEDDGQLVFGVYTGQENKVTTSSSYNDGDWHHVVARQGGDGMQLYVDGALEGTNPQTGAQNYDGYWKIGGDPTWGSSSAYIDARIDEAAVYSTVLSAATIASHYSLGLDTEPNVAPVAAFTVSKTDLSVAVDGSGSSDTDGTIADYEWDFGDGTVESGLTATTSHAYAAAGRYDVKLTVTDNAGGTAEATESVSVVAVNQPPTAVIDAETTGASVAVDGFGSSDPDGSVSSYTWEFGDGATAIGATATHTYGTSGTYTVRLTVLDDRGASAIAETTVNVVVVVPNVAPVAAFESSSADLVASFDASGSSDSDGSVVSYSWNFGDSATATGVTASHTYAAAGTYSATLVVTDNAGATNSISKSVTVTAGAPDPDPDPAGEAFVSDVFARTASNGLGNADVGGAWTSVGVASYLSVAGDAGLLTLPRGGVTARAYLGETARTSTDMRVQLSADKLGAGGGTYVYAVGRRVSNTAEYRARVKYVGSRVGVSLSGLLGSSTETPLASEVLLPGNIVAGTKLNVRLQVDGVSPTTVRVKVWADGTAEPTDWLLSATDSAPVLQVPGSVGVAAYLSGSATNAPVTVSVRNLTAQPVE